MKTRSMLAGGLTMYAALIAAGYLLCGCESSKTDQDVILVTPSSTTLSNGVGTVVLTASVGTNATQQLFLPLTWTLSQPTLGHIEAQAGTSAVYVGSGQRGSNAVTVKDRGKGEGVAVIYQP